MAKRGRANHSDDPLTTGECEQRLERARNIGPGTRVVDLRRFRVHVGLEHLQATIGHAFVYADLQRRPTLPREQKKT